MSGRRILFRVLVVVAAVAAAACLIAAWRLRDGLSARQQPLATEARMARIIRGLAMPAQARTLKNPVPYSADVLQEARRHFADHCAVCHANDGSGNATLGENLFPRAPDMRQAATQSLTDGEIYFIIKNGIRWTGMPAWGEPGGNDRETWELVYFIRHLPQLTQAERLEMEHYNPKSPAEIEEEKQEEKFLNGSSPGQKENQQK